MGGDWLRVPVQPQPLHVSVRLRALLSGTGPARQAVRWTPGEDPTASWAQPAKEQPLQKQQEEQDPDREEGELPEEDPGAQHNSGWALPRPSFATPTTGVLVGRQDQGQAVDLQLLLRGSDLMQQLLDEQQHVCVLRG